MELSGDLLLNGFFLAILAAFTFFFGLIINSDGINSKHNSIKYVIGAVYVVMFIILPFSIAYSIIFELAKVLIFISSWPQIIRLGAFLIIGVYIIENLEFLSNRGKKISNLTKSINLALNRTNLVHLPPITKKDHIFGTIILFNTITILLQLSLLVLYTLPITITVFTLILSMAIIVRGAEALGKYNSLG